MGNSKSVPPSKIYADTSDDVIKEIFKADKKTLDERAKTVELPPPAVPENESEMPTEQELTMVQKLQEVFVEFFAERKAAGTDYPAFFGDLFLTRVIRGMEGKWTDIWLWFVSMVLALKEIDADPVIQSCIQTFAAAEKEGRRIQCSDFPHYEDIVKYHKSIFSLGKLSSSGDLINYQPQHSYGCQDSRGIWENCYDKFIVYFRHGFLMNMVELDKMSRDEKRLIKKACVFDMKGCHGLSDVSYKPYDDAFAKDMTSYQMRLSAEVFSIILVTNVPWYLCKLMDSIIGALRRLKAVPARTLDRFKIYKDDGTSDPDVLKFVGAEQLMECYTWRAPIPPEALKDDEFLVGDASIKGGRTLERVIGMSSGKTVSWKVEVKPGSTMLGTNVDVLFSVQQIVDAAEGASELEMEIVDAVPERKISVEEGEVAGSFTAEKGGLLRFVFSNAHSWVRTKDITFSIEEQ